MHRQSALLAKIPEIPELRAISNTGSTSAMCQGDIPVMPGTFTPNVYQKVDDFDSSNITYNTFQCF